MKITIRRELSIPELRQSIHEQLNRLEDRFGVRYARNTTIYLSFTNGFGNEVRCRDSRGGDVNEINIRGAYPCAADRMESLWMEYDHE